MNMEEALVVTRTVFFGDRFSRTPREIDEAYNYIENLLKGKNFIQEVKDKLMSTINWEKCGCGCPTKRKPADSWSVACIRVVQQIEIALATKVSEE